MLSERRAPPAARGAAVLRHRRVQARQRHLRPPRRRRAADPRGGRSVGPGAAQRDFRAAGRRRVRDPRARHLRPGGRVVRRAHRARDRAASRSASRATTCASPAAWAWRSIRTTPPTAEDLVAHADAAMYQAKEAGKNTWRMYREDAHAYAGRCWRGSAGTSASRTRWRTICCACTTRACTTAARWRLSHVEALVRMVDREDPARVVMPGSFIPVAEKTGKILDIDRWVISACADMLARYPGVGAIALNVSGRSLNEPTLPRFIIDALRIAGVAPGRLIVELTETSAVSDLHDAQRFIESMRESGVRVCLDDFGVGLLLLRLSEASGRGHAQDRRAVHPRSADRPRQPGVREGHRGRGARPARSSPSPSAVEDAATLEMLRALGVDMAQGYHLEEPTAQHPSFKQ